MYDFLSKVGQFRRKVGQFNNSIFYTILDTNTIVRRSRHSTVFCIIERKI